MNKYNPPSNNPLSKREQEVFNLLLEGKSNKEISSLLSITQKTVEEHLTNIYMKSGTKSRVEALLWGIEQARDFPHGKSR